MTTNSDEDGKQVAVPRRVGEAVNSLHNNKLALLYVGSDCYKLLHQYFTSTQGLNPSLLGHLYDIAKHGIDIPSDVPEEPPRHVNIIFRGGGDLKFQSCQAGLYGHGGEFFCTRCECPSADRGHSMLRCNGHEKRTFQRCCMLAHKYGPEWGLEEPYQCPGCNKRIAESDQHPPLSAAAIKAYPRAHYLGSTMAAPQ